MGMGFLCVCFFRGEGRREGYVHSSICFYGQECSLFSLLVMKERRGCNFLCFCFMKSCRRWSPAPTSLLLLPRPAVGVPRVQELTVHSGVPRVQELTVHSRVPRVQELTVHSDESLRAVEGSPLRWNIARFKCFAYCQEAHVSSFCLSGSFDCSFSVLLKISWN